MTAWSDHELGPKVAFNSIPTHYTALACPYHVACNTILFLSILKWIPRSNGTFIQKSLQICSCRLQIGLTLLKPLPHYCHFVISIRGSWEWVYYARHSKKCFRFSFFPPFNNQIMRAIICINRIGASIYIQEDLDSWLFTLILGSWILLIFTV